MFLGLSKDRFYSLSWPRLHRGDGWGARQVRCGTAAGCVTSAMDDAEPLTMGMGVGMELGDGDGRARASIQQGISLFKSKMGKKTKTTGKTRLDKYVFFVEIHVGPTLKPPSPSPSSTFVSIPSQFLSPYNVDTII